MMLHKVIQGYSHMERLGHHPQCTASLVGSNITISRNNNEGRKWGHGPLNINIFNIYFYYFINILYLYLITNIQIKLFIIFHSHTQLLSDLQNISWIHSLCKQEVGPGDRKGFGFLNTNKINLLPKW